ncbi:MAG: Crp/Fnr family transcriptional regulator [Dyadobacter sp.]|uniref:Crp/Fnr family transcriptional regulator n=1 Tax=Dyadobacter sp. TaxID=1914288 RepID=UPI003263055D
MEDQLFEFIAKYMPLLEEEKKAIIDLAIFKSFKKGTVLLKEGELSKDGYFVLKGCLRTYYVIEGEEKTTAFYTESDSFAPLCIVTNKPSELYISCVEDSMVLVNNPEIDQIMFQKFPRFETLCRILSEELVAKNQASFDDFKTSSPKQRYLNLLKTRPELLQRVPQHQLASFLGMKPESLSRIRKRLLVEAK